MAVSRAFMFHQHILFYLDFSLSSPCSMVPNNSALVCLQVYRKLYESLDISTNSAVGGTNSQQMALLSKAKTSLYQAKDRLESENNEVLFDYTIVLFQDCLFNLFPNKPWVLHVCSTSLLKTLWEKKKLLVKSNFSFSHSVFYPLGELSAIFIKFKIVVCKLFQFGRVYNSWSGNGLTLSQTSPGFYGSGVKVF